MSSMRCCGANDYTGIAAEVYDLMRGDDPVSGEYQFYEKQLGGMVGPHLEIGCGTGRILLRLMQAGFDVEGLDSSADMLGLCQEKAAAIGVKPTLHLQRMQDFQLVRSFGVIFAPLVTLSLVADDAEAVQVLGACYQHLRPGGQILFSTTPPPASRPEPWGLAQEVTLRGQIISVTQSSEWLAADRILVEHFRFENNNGTSTLLDVQTIRLRCWEAGEMVRLLDGCGFDDIEVVQGAELPTSFAESMLVFRARRAP